MADEHSVLRQAISVLENYGDHHEWCATQGTRTVKPSAEHDPVDCDCGFDKEMAELNAVAWAD